MVGKLTWDARTSGQPGGRAAEASVQLVCNSLRCCIDSVQLMIGKLDRHNLQTCVQA